MYAKETSYMSESSFDLTPESTVVVIHKERTKIRKKPRIANYKSKVQQLQINIAQLLAKKKSLNSKVVSQEFEAFQAAVDKIQNDEGSASEVKQCLVGLEKALKKEGLFKNVKGIFVGMKREFLAAPSSKPSPPIEIDNLDDDDKKENKSRVGTAVYSHRPETKAPTRYAATVHIEDVKMVNKAVGKLFGHLKLPKGSDSKDVTMLSIQGRSSTIVKKKDFDDTNFSEVIKRLKQFEKELNRQRAAQQTEIMRLSEENQTLRKSMAELKKEHDRIKGTQPIASRAKDKHVARLEQKFRTQKKGMEGKISEIETELQVSLEKTLREKDMLEQMIMDGVTRLKEAIISLHHKLCVDDDEPREMTTILEKDENDDTISETTISVDELMSNIASIEEEANNLQERNDKLQAIITEKETDIQKLRKAISDISSEIGKMHGTVTQLDGSSQFNLGHGKAGSMVKGLETKEKDLAIAKLQQVNASIQQYKRLLQEGTKTSLTPKNDMKVLTDQINRMYGKFKHDVERFDSEKSRLSMDTLLDEPTQQDEVNVMIKKLTKIEKAYKVMKEKESEKNLNDQW